MLITGKSVIISATTTITIFSHLFPKENGRKFAKKKDYSEKSRDQHAILPLSVSSRRILAQSVVTVLGLGFIDAGYSGDWSRIGVISKESEDLLKIAAFVVVPLCILFIFSFSKKIED